MLSEYRQRFGQFHEDLFREDYLFRSGRKSACDTAHIHSEYSDLFRLSVVEELRAELKETAAHRETEVKSIQHLIAFALEQNLLMRVRDVSDEIEEYKNGAKINWDGEQKSFRHSATLLAGEPDATRRRDLHARRADVFYRTQDLYAERFQKLREGARELGFENYVEMRRELRGVGVEALVTQAEQLLAKTESKYVSALSPLLLREAGVSPDQATAADLGWLRRYTRFDAFFRREQMPRMYRDLFAALGFNSENQANVEIDSAARPNKQSQAFCSPIQVPDEIKLAVNFVGGQANYREFLRATGRAQHFAWTSRNLYPEFRVGGDGAVGDAWARLFENMLVEPAWLAGTLGFVETAEFRHALSVFQMMSLRREAAMLIYEAEFHAGKLEGNAAPRYAELMTDAVRVRFDDAEAFSDVSDDFRPANVLRAAAFEAQMRDFLKTQFGSHWWTARKAGETLIDLWNTGQRYSVEELAAMIGLGQLDFDCLIVEALNQSEG